MNSSPISLNINSDGLLNQINTTIADNPINDIIKTEKMILDNIQWIKIIFEKIVQHGMKDCTIENVIIIDKRLASQKGQNFLSQLWRITLRYTCLLKESSDRFDELVHLILKEEPLPGLGLDYIRENNIFSVELMVFENVLPFIEKSIGKQLAPKFYYGSIKPPAIILEDLLPCGFKNKCRQQGLSYAHMLIAIEAIALFHAGSVALNEQCPGYLQSFVPRIMSETINENMYNFLDFIIEYIAENIQNWPEPWAKSASNKLLKLLKTQRKRILMVTEYDEDEFCVLNHGDCWVGNFMFKEDENNEPVDVRLLDYQMAVWTSPVIDLFYFISICPEVDLKVDLDEFFLKKYLEILSHQLIKLNCQTKAPSLEQLKNAMFKRRIYAVMSALIYYPRMTADEADIEALDDSLKKGTTKLDIFKNLRTVEALKKTIPSLLEKGYLD